MCSIFCKLSIWACRGETETETETRLQYCTTIVLLILVKPYNWKLWCFKIISTITEVEMFTLMACVGFVFVF